MLYSQVWIWVGGALIIATTYDFYATTVTASGSGPISKRICRGLWRSFLVVHRRRRSHKLLKVGGPLMLLLLILTWFAMCWVGWLLVFSGSENAVINASTKQPATFWERVHYAGYTITTIGYGNFRAASPAAQVGSIIAGFNGLFLVTLAISYTIPVVSAAVEKRKLALVISAMGATANELMDNGQGSGDYGPLVSQTQQLNMLVAALTEKHYAYPVLHYFHAELYRNSLALNLARLSETLIIVLFAFPDLPGDSKSQLNTSKRLIDNFVGTLAGDFTGTAFVAPKPLDCAGLKALTRSNCSPMEVEKHLEAQPERQLLLAYVRNDGWDWSDVHPQEQG